MGYGPPGGGFGGGSGGGAGGIGRLAGPAVIGGVVGGVLSAVPLLNVLNCCFCLLSLAGVALGLGMFLRSNPTDKVSAGEAAASGAISGAVAGVISSILGMITNLILGSVLASLYSSFPRELRQAMVQRAAGGILMIPVSLMIFTATGALGGFLAMQLFWKDRLAA
jgi:hypothetical protein